MVASPLTTDQLRAFPLFESLAEGDLEHLLERHLTSALTEDQLLVQERDWGETLFLIRAGMAKVRCYSPEGEEVVLCLLGPGDVFGEMALLDEQPRSADVLSLTPLNLVKFSGALFRQLMLNRPALALAIAKLQSKRLRDLNRRFAIHSADAATRLLNALAQLACLSGVGADVLSPFPALAQRELAAIAGLSRETTSRTLSKLRQRGYLDESEGELRLVSAEPLKRRCLL
jgi:CRP-like cAMP-binding protein